MKIFKKNQIIIYVIALMLVVAGYLNFSTDDDKNDTIQTSGVEEVEKVEEEADEMANIGDAQLVSSNVVEEEKNTCDDYFSTSKLERDSMYSQMIETYENILNSNNSLEIQKQSASEEIKKINNLKNSIMICENLIKTKGFDDVIVFENGGSVSVVVKDEQLGPEKVAQIQNIISREMSVKIENIHISNK